MASIGMLSVGFFGRITPLPTKRSCGFSLANATLPRYSAPSFTPRWLLMPAASLSVNSPTTEFVR